MKDPSQMSEAELDALWAFGATKAEMRAATEKIRHAQELVRVARAVEAYRAAHPEATARDAIILLLVDMARDQKRQG